MIQPPAVVPGLAQIHVRVHSSDAEKVTVLPVRWDAGTRGAPPPDTAKPVEGETNLFTAQLWLMNAGSYSVFVDVSGPRGKGTAIVPLNSLAYQRLTLSKPLGLFFAAFGVFLICLLISIVGAAIRESTLSPGAELSRTRAGSAMIGMLIAAAIAAGALCFGNNWWKSTDRFFVAHRLYENQEISPELETGANGETRLNLAIGSASRRTDSTPLVPDHERIMHLFLIRRPAGDVFAHLHPIRSSERKDGRFVTVLPSLPAGDYDLYADITHESGLAETLTNTIHLAAETKAIAELSTPDDSLDLLAPKPMAALDLDKGFQMHPENGATFRANEETTLRFNVTTATGASATLEPYLGMYGHLIIQNADGSVFIHLHPLGSISMASQKLFAEREQSGYLANQPLDLLCSPATPLLSFPYAFPKPGTYRLWLQTKLAGKIQTAGYTVTVE